MSDHTWTCTHPNISVLTREDFWGQEPCKSHKSTSHVIPLYSHVGHHTSAFIEEAHGTSPNWLFFGWLDQGETKPKNMGVLDGFFCSIYESLAGELALLFSQCRQASSKRGNSWAFALLQCYNWSVASLANRI